MNSRGAVSSQLASPQCLDLTEATGFREDLGSKRGERLEEKSLIKTLRSCLWAWSCSPGPGPLKEMLGQTKHLHSLWGLQYYNKTPKPTPNVLHMYFCCPWWYPQGPWTFSVPLPQTSGFPAIPPPGFEGLHLGTTTGTHQMRGTSSQEGRGRGGVIRPGFFFQTPQLNEWPFLGTPSGSGRGDGDEPQKSTSQSSPQEERREHVL